MALTELIGCHDGKTRQKFAVTDQKQTGIADAEAPRHVAVTIQWAHFESQQRGRRADIIHFSLPRQFKVGNLCIAPFDAKSMNPLAESERIAGIGSIGQEPLRQLVGTDSAIDSTTGTVRNNDYAASWIGGKGIFPLLGLVSHLLGPQFAEAG